MPKASFPCFASWSAPVTLSRIHRILVAEKYGSIVKPVTLELENETNRNSLNLQFLCDKKLSSEKLESSLAGFVKDYEDWLIKQEDLDTPKKYDAARIRILERIKSSISRMKAGVETIASNPKVFEAFQLANLAMLMQMVHGSYFSKSIKNK